MSWVHREREISWEDYYDIEAGRKNEDDLFTEAELCAYGAALLDTYERDGKYYIYYGISDNCD